MIAVAVFAHRYPWYSVPPPPGMPPQGTIMTAGQVSSVGGSALSLRPLDSMPILPDSGSAMSEPNAVFLVPVRMLTYGGDFIASGVTEGADGDFYVTYYWDKGSTPYDPDRYGALTGSQIREIFAGAFLDRMTIIGRNGGYPAIDVDIGSTVHGSTLWGIWYSSGAGVKKVGPESIIYSPSSARGCDWCRMPPLDHGPKYCESFGGGRLCDSSEGVTFEEGVVKEVIDKDAYLVGAGPHRFLIVERPSGRPPRYVEGFAASD